MTEIKGLYWSEKLLADRDEMIILELEADH